MLEAAVPSPNTLPVEEPMVLLKEAFEPNDAVAPNAGELPKDGGLPNTGALPKPPAEGKTDHQQPLPQRGQKETSQDAVLSKVFFTS